MVLSSPFLLCKEQHYLHNLFRLDLKVLLLDDEAIDIQMYLQTVAVELTGRRSGIQLALGCLEWNCFTADV